jgi:protein O-mannosyl-transferase
VLMSGFTCRRILISLLLFSLALLSKETAIVFPVLAMSLLFYRSDRRWSLRTYLSTWPFWLLAIFYLLARATVLNFGGVFRFYSHEYQPVVDRLYTFLATLPVYLKIMVWPINLHMERTFLLYTHLWTPQVLAGLAILSAAFIGIVWKPSQRTSPLAWGVLWAAATYFPVSGILTEVDAVIFEHWLYLPTMGLALGLGQSLALVNTQRLRLAFAVFAVLVACLFGAMTFQQNTVWYDRITFYTHILDSGENTAKLHTNLGITYAEQENYPEAIKQFHIAIALDETFELAHYNLAVTLIKRDDNPESVSESINQLQRALEIDPNDYRAWIVLSVIFKHLGDYDKESAYRLKADAIKKQFWSK